MSVSESRKSRPGTPSIVSQSRLTQRRPVEAAMLHRHRFRVKATRLPRRQFLYLAAGAAALPAVSSFAWAQTYPARPERIIVGFPPGGGSDILARLMGQWLSERLGRPFIVDNRPGAGGNIGNEAVVRAQADGYTLLQRDALDELKFNFIRDIAPVASIFRAPHVLDVNPSVPAKTVPELIAYSKANPGKLSMGSGGIGTTQHVSGELFKMMTGVNMLHVPYRGGAPARASSSRSFELCVTKRMRSIGR